MKRGDRNDLSIQRGSIELIQLCNDVNEMLKIIEMRNLDNMKMQNQLYQLEYAKIEAQLYALRNQIQPHFLNNTLQTIRGMAMYHNITGIARIATYVADILRYAMCEQPNARIKEELDIIKKYINIMNERHNNKYILIEQSDPYINNFFLPRMVIQPAIENAVKHAFNNMYSGAEISLFVNKEDGDIIISISDNGCGISSIDLDRLRQHIELPFLTNEPMIYTGIGLKNINQRLRMKYGSTYGITISSTEGIGTQIKLRIPILTENQTLGFG